MSLLLASLAKRALRAQLAIAAAVLALGSIAALVEGRAPASERIASLALPFAASLGGGWTLAAWRREGGDVALASLGRGPQWVTAALWMLCGLTVSLTPTFSAPSTAILEISSGLLRARSSTLRLDVRWDETGAHRSDLAAGAPGERFAELPPPVSGPTRRSRSGPGILLGIRLALLGAVLLLLSASRRPPGLAAVVIAATAASALGYAATAALRLIG